MANNIIERYPATLQVIEEALEKGAQSQEGLSTARSLLYRCYELLTARERTDNEQELVREMYRFLHG